VIKDKKCFRKEKKDLESIKADKKSFAESSEFFKALRRKL